MTKLTETQTVIVTKALANDRFVLSHNKSGSTTDPRAYGSAIASLVKNGLAILVSSPFNVKEGHYVKDGQRVRISDKGIAALEAMHEGPAKAAKPAKTAAPAKAEPAATKVDVFTTEGDEVKKNLTVAKAAKLMDLDDAELLWALEDAGRCDSDDYVAVPAGNAFPDADPEEMGEDEEGDERPGTIVKPGYKAYYASLKEEGGSGSDNNDTLAQWFRTEFTATFVDGETNKKRKGLDVQALWAFAAENGINTRPYEGLNNGQKSMNVRNIVRGMIKNGKDIHYNGRLIFKGIPRPAKTEEAA